MTVNDVHPPAVPDATRVPFREADVDLGAVSDSTSTLAAELSGREHPLRLVADLGADAEGHGLIATAPTVLQSGAAAILVPYLADAIALRRSGVSAPVLSWLHPIGTDFAGAAGTGVVVRTPAEVTAAVSARLADIRLLVETGAGLPGLDAPQLTSALADLAEAGLDASGLIVALPEQAGASSRLRAEDLASAAVAQWRAGRLPGHPLDVIVIGGDDATADVPAWATATTAAGALFGLTGSGTPAMTLWAPVTGIKTATAGEGVSYGYIYRTRVAGHLALVSLGYGDGVDRAAGNAAPISIGGSRYTIAGRVAMDAHVIDVGDDAPPRIGTRAVAFGDPARGEPAVGEWADALGVTSAEITSRLSARVHRGYAPETASTPLPPVPEVWADIDLGAFRANLDHIRSVVAPAKLMVVLKADAYGHGRVPMGVAAVAAGIRSLGSLDIDTGLALRAAGIDSDTRILAWLYPPGQHFGAATAADIDLGVSTPAEVARIIETATPGTVPRLHLKIDTGLRRNGATPADWPALVRTAVDAERRGLVSVHGAWTHIAEASDDEDTLAVQRFSEAVAVAEGLGARFTVRHLAASSAGLRRADSRFDMVRMGGHCWGIPSFDGVTPADIGLAPVMTLRSRVAAVRATPEGRRAFVPVGFALGVPSVAAGRVSIAVGGRRYPVVAVHRDHLELEVDPAVQAGDEAVLFGSGSRGEQTVREWGDLIGTLGDEIVTRLSVRISRRYLD